MCSPVAANGPLPLVASESGAPSNLPSLFSTTSCMHVWEGEPNVLINYPSALLCRTQWPADRALKLQRPKYGKTGGVYIPVFTRLYGRSYKNNLVLPCFHLIVHHPRVSFLLFSSQSACFRLLLHRIYGSRSSITN